MNTRDMMKKRLTAIAAICSAAFLFAACEPQDDQPGAGQQDADSPTYGEPDRPADPAQDPAQDPATQQEQQDQQQDQWEEDTGTTN